MPPFRCTDDAIAEVIAEATSIDGLPPFSEHKSGVIEGSEPGVVGCWTTGDDIGAVGVAAAHLHADGSGHWAVEVAVRPSARHPRFERHAIARGLALAPPESVTFWTHRDDQRAAAETLGLVTVREVALMELLLPAPAPLPPPGYTIRPFGEGRDEGLIVAINNAAFAGHRENDNMTIDAMRNREAARWFDPAGLLVATRDAEPAGFCWTKVHDDGTGEIYIIGVHPDHQGRGVGRWLVLEGLSDLHGRRSVDRATLWTERDNRVAVRLYEDIGFTETVVTREMSRAQPKG